MFPGEGGRGKAPQGDLAPWIGPLFQAVVYDRGRDGDLTAGSENCLAWDYYFLLPGEKKNLITHVKFSSVTVTSSWPWLLCMECVKFAQINV